MRGILTNYNKLVIFNLKAVLCSWNDSVCWCWRTGIKNSLPLIAICIITREGTDSRLHQSPSRNQ